MYIKNQFLFLSFISLAANSYGMKHERSESYDSSESPTKKQKSEHRKFNDEEKFILLAREQTLDHQKLIRLKLILKELLTQPDNKFYNKIVDLINKLSTKDLQIKEFELKKSPFIWKNIANSRKDSFKSGEDIYKIQADDNQFNPGKKIKFIKNGQEITNLDAKAKVYGVKFNADGNFAISLSWPSINNSILELWDLNNKTNPKTESIASIENWADDIEFLGWDKNNEFITISRSDKWYIEPFTRDKNLKEILHENFQKLYGETTVRKDTDGKEFTEQTGIIKYLLINYIINHGNKTPFIITYPRLKAIFKQLPQIIQKAFVDLKYVKLQ